MIFATNKLFFASTLLDTIKKKKNNKKYFNEN